jgi:hypothetical protein
VSFGVISDCLFLCLLGGLYDCDLFTGFDGSEVFSALVILVDSTLSALSARLSFVTADCDLSTRGDGFARSPRDELFSDFSRFERFESRPSDFNPVYSCFLMTHNISMSHQYDRVNRGSGSLVPSSI